MAYNVVMSVGLGMLLGLHGKCCYNNFLTVINKASIVKAKATELTRTSKTSKTLSYHVLVTPAFSGGGSIGIIGKCGRLLTYLDLSLYSSVLSWTSSTKSGLIFDNVKPESCYCLRFVR